jgi:hypothetical protein
MGAARVTVCHIYIKGICNENRRENSGVHNIVLDCLIRDLDSKTSLAYYRLSLQF